MEENMEEKWIEADGYDINDEHNDGDGRINEGDDDLVQVPGGLFADPDPFDEFSLRFWIPEKQQQHQQQETFHEDDEHKSSVVSIRLSGIKAENGQLLDSTGLTLWRASSLLCEFMSGNPNLLRGKNVLEVGAGLGLCGILAYKIGAKRVVMTDGDTDTLKAMRHNVEINCSHNDRDDGNNLSLSTITCQQLRWGRNLPDFKRKWCSGSGKGLFDVIIGSDIIYVEEIIEPLFETVMELLGDDQNSSEGKFLLAYARRNVNIDLVLKCAAKNGLKWTEPKKSEGVFIFSKV